MLKTKKHRIDAGVAEKSYTSSEIAELAGVSLRQLQWWDEQKVVSPKHEGHKRLYLAEEAVEIAVIAELRRKGFSLQKIRRVLRFLQKEMGRRLAEVFSPDTDLHLVTDGQNIYLEENNLKIIDIFKKANQPMFLVCVTDQVKRLNVGVVRKPVKAETAAAPAGKKARAG